MQCRPSMVKAVVRGRPWSSARGWQLLAETVWELESCSAAAPTHTSIWQPLSYDSDASRFGEIYRFCFCLRLLKGEACSLAMPPVNTLSGSSNTYFMIWLLCFNQLSSSSSTRAGGLVALYIQLWWLKAALHLAPFFAASPEVWGWLVLAAEPTFAISLSTFHKFGSQNSPLSLCRSGIPTWWQNWYKNLN